MGWLSLLAAAFQLVTELLKIRAQHAANLGVKKLSPEQRKLIDNVVVDAMRTKDTSGLEAMLKGVDPPEAAPFNSQTAATVIVAPANSGSKSA